MLFRSPVQRRHVQLYSDFYCTHCRRDTSCSPAFAGARISAAPSRPPRPGRRTLRASSHGSANSEMTLRPRSVSLYGSGFWPVGAARSRLVGGGGAAASDDILLSGAELGRLAGCGRSKVKWFERKGRRCERDEGKVRATHSKSQLASCQPACGAGVPQSQQEYSQRKQHSEHAEGSKCCISLHHPRRRAPPRDARSLGGLLLLGADLEDL